MASTSLMFARRLSTSSVTREMIKTPIQVFGVEGRYASALYSAASKNKQLEKVEKDLIEVQALLKSDVPFREFVLNPTLKKEAKRQAMEVVASKKKTTDATKNLLVLMAENGRLTHLDAVAASFRTLMAAHRGEVVCEVTTAKELDAAGKKELEAALQAFLKKGEVLKYSTKVDPALIGGMVVTIGDKYVDMSIASKIKKYTAAISSAV
ncbi:ATP synthase subunit O, mitochondrial-like [Amphibalanus amphitrite]|uniref:ATP synthase subunit O, mitochondrial-like n=1 Tax=Amphibalanus amphitrite TaxID=1232801 RepID=UPI001C92A766|nr:ATP synthase subunit O, mitochondrial-like [Amphibalanus amphitrite]